MNSAFGFLPADFHFLRPEWFYALIPLALMLWVVYRWRRTATGWQGVIAGHLYQYLVSTLKFFFVASLVRKKQLS